MQHTACRGYKIYYDLYSYSCNCAILYYSQWSHQLQLFHGPSGTIFICYAKNVKHTHLIRFSYSISEKCTHPPLLDLAICSYFHSSHSFTTPCCLHDYSMLSHAPVDQQTCDFSHHVRNIA